MQAQRAGYVRVSTIGQHTDRQLDRTFVDKASAKEAARPQLAEMLAYVQKGDTVIVHSMDRFARNLEDLRRMLQELTSRGVKVEFLRGGFADGYSLVFSHGCLRGV